MKHKQLFLIFFIAFIQNIWSQKEPIELVYTKSIVANDVGKLTHINQISSVFTDEMKKDTVTIKMLMKFTMNELLNKNEKIVISKNTDTVWKKVYEKNKLKEVYSLTNDTVMRLHTLFNVVEPSIYYKSKYYNHDRFGRFEVKFDTNKTKNINGFNCFYVKIIDRNKRQSKIDLGKSICEMYVTDKINLPMLSIFLSDISLKGFFPLEIKKYEEFNPNLFDELKVSDIKY